MRESRPPVDAVYTELSSERQQKRTTQYSSAQVSWAVAAYHFQTVTVKSAGKCLSAA